MQEFFYWFCFLYQPLARAPLTAYIPLSGYVAGCVRLSAGLFVLPHAPSLRLSASPTAGFSEMANGTCFGSLCGRKAQNWFDRSTISFHQISPAGNGHPFWSCTKICSGRVIGIREQGSRSQRKRRYARYWDRLGAGRRRKKIFCFIHSGKENKFSLPAYV